MLRLSPRLYLAIPLMLGFAAGCGDDEAQIEELLPAVSAARVEAVDLTQRIRASGDLNAKLHTTVAAEIEGRVTEIAAEEGSRVDRDAVVLELDPERRQLELAAARARLTQSRAQYGKERRQTERVRKLSTQEVASQQQLDEAEAALALAYAEMTAARAEVGVLERALQDASVAAPFAGRVARRHVELGEFVQKGDALFELVDLDSLELVFSLTELDTERVAVGDPVELEVAPFPDERFSGTVSFVSPTVEPATRTLRVKAEVPNREGRLRPGLFARVQLRGEGKPQALMVPEEALIQHTEGALLFRIGEDDRVQQVAVRTGATHQGRVEVRGAVSVGDRIVRRGHGGLADGALVSVVEGPRSARAPRDLAAETERGEDELSGDREGRAAEL